MLPSTFKKMTCSYSLIFFKGLYYRLRIATCTIFLTSSQAVNSPLKTTYFLFEEYCSCFAWREELFYLHKVCCQVQTYFCLVILQPVLFSPQILRYIGWYLAWYRKSWSCSSKIIRSLEWFRGAHWCSTEQLFI